MTWGGNIGGGGGGTIGGGRIVDGKIVDGKPPVHCMYGKGPCDDSSFCRLNPRACDHKDGRDHDNVRVIHKTVLVHDRNNNQETIVINANPLTGQCLITQTQIATIPGLVAQLLNVCPSITIIPTRLWLKVKYISQYW
jgi:hypothetical protein